MALDYFRLMGGVEIEKDDLSSRARILIGTGVPGGDTGEQDAAPIGSVFMRTDAAGGAQFYWKSGTLNATSDWEIGVTKDYVDGLTGGSSWREPVRVMDSTTYADSSAFPVGGVVDGVTLANGDRVLFSDVTTGNDNIYIWNSGTSTWAEDPLNPVSDGDAIFVREGSQADSMYFFNGTSWVKYADSNSYGELAYLRAFVGKNLVGSEMPSYSSTNVIANSDSLETAVGKLDTEVGYIDTFIGKSAGNELPTYTSTDVVTQNGSLETAVGELDAAMGNGSIVNVGGNFALASDMTWGGGLNDVTEALDQLNAAIGDRSYVSDFNVADGQTIAASVNALDVAIGSRTYSSDNVVTDGQSLTASIDALDVAVGNLQSAVTVVTGTNVAATNHVMDSIPVSLATEVKWMVQVRENGTPANRRALEVHALTDGSSVDHTEYAVIKLGANIAGFDVNVDVSGGNIRILVSATNNIDFVVKRVAFSAF